VAIPGELRHDQNPNGAGFPSEDRQGYDKVLAVVDAIGCRVVNFINLDAEYGLVETAFSADDSLLFVTQPGKTRAYSGPSFKRVVLTFDERISLMGESAWGKFLYTFPNGYIVVFGENSGITVVSSGGHDVRVVGSFQMLQLPFPGETLGMEQRGETTKTGSAIGRIDVAFADDKDVVLVYRTVTRKAGVTITQHHSLLAYDYKVKSSATTELAPGANQVQVTRGASGKLEATYRVDGKVSAITMAASPTKK
jgi:hypothetical protein